MRISYIIKWKDATKFNLNQIKLTTISYLAGIEG